MLIHRQNHKNNLKNMSIFNEGLWKVMMVREQSVSEYGYNFSAVLLCGMFKTCWYVCRVDRDLILETWKIQVQCVEKKERVCMKA